MRVTPDCDSINSLDISDANGIQTFPEVAFGGGNYMVVWTDRRSGTYYRIYGARVTPQGTLLDPNGFQIGPTVNAYQYYPSIAFDGTRFLVIWNYSSPYAITGRFINTDGSLGDTLRVTTAGGYIYSPRIAFDQATYLVAWVERVETIYTLKCQFVAPDGSLIGSPFTVASPVYYYYSIGLHFDGINYIITWSTQSGSYYEIWGRKYDPFGNPVGDAFQISDAHNSSCYYCDVVAGSDNHYLNVWCQYRSAQYDIYGNVDIEIVGAEEQGNVVLNDCNFGSTIVRGPIRLPQNKTCRVFDISGREVNPLQLAAGIYFVEIEGEVRQKIVKIK